LAEQFLFGKPAGFHQFRVHIGDESLEIGGGEYVDIVRQVEGATADGQVDLHGWAHRGHGCVRPTLRRPVLTHERSPSGGAVRITSICILLETTRHDSSRRDKAWLTGTAGVACPANRPPESSALKSCCMSCDEQGRA